MSSGKKQYDNLLLINVNNLKDYLTVRGISVNVYNKIELVALAYSAAEIDPPIILSSADLTKNLEEEYSKRLREFDPKNIEKELRVDDLTAWLKVNLGTFLNIFWEWKNLTKNILVNIRIRKPTAISIVVLSGRF